MRHNCHSRAGGNPIKKLLHGSLIKSGMTKGVFFGPILIAQNPRGVFGTIKAPNEIIPLIRKGGEGAGGISLVINNLITLIFILGIVVFMFMILFGAFQWMTSGGDKEAVTGARNRIIHAIIGIVLLAGAFAILEVVGTFTGFTDFFSG